MRTIGAATCSGLFALALMLVSGCAAGTVQPMAAGPQAGAVGGNADAATSAAARIEALLTGTARAAAVRRDSGGSWIAPQTSGAALLYVSEYAAGRVEVLSYPDGTPVGKLAGFLGPNGLCSDGAGHLWVTDTLDQRIVEYQTGSAKQLAVLHDPDEYPVDCSVDPVTGDLAVTNIYGSGSPSLAAGSIAIYKSARGKPQGPYYDSLMYYMYFCHYDGSGNLFFDGESYGGQFRFAEMPRGGSGITDITVDQSIEQPGDIEPDGTALALGDQQAHVIYELSVSGSQASVIGTTPLQRTGEIEQFALGSGIVVGAQGTDNRVSTWNYPGGGAPTATIRRLATPIGVSFASGSASGPARHARTLAALHAPGGPHRRAPLRAWMAPAAKSSDLLYVADSYNGVVDVYAYPQATQVGTLTGFSLPQGECSDAHGDVFITNTNTSQVFEYAHGGSEPIATVNDPNENPVGCAVDPGSGTLAVSNLTANGYGGSGSIALYRHARGTPTLYFDPDIYFMFFCGYDDKGNLFVDGQHFGGGGTGFQLAELTPHARVFRNIAMPVVVDFPGGVQWDGKDVAVGDQEADVIYRVHVTGLTASIAGTTPLGGALDVVQFWKQGNVVIGPDSLSGDVGFWRYPAGGSPLQTIDGLGGPEGATVSVSGSGSRSGSRAYRSASGGAFRSARGAAVATRGAKCGHALNFLSDFNNGLLDVYDGTILCRVSYGFNNPNGIAVDAKGNLYVAQKGAQDVAILKPPYARIASSLGDSGEDPAGIAFCKGYIAVTNLESNGSGAGSVSIYAQGATQPSYTLQDPNAVAEYSAAYDPAGNLYTSYLNQNGSGSVNEWVGAKGDPVELTAIATGFPGGMQYLHGALWVGDQQTPTITLWAPPFTQASDSIDLNGSDDPVDFVVDSAARRIVVADAALNEGIEFTMKGSEIATLPGNGGGLAVGIAYWPKR